MANLILHSMVHAFCTAIWPLSVSKGQLERDQTCVECYDPDIRNIMDRAQNYLVYRLGSSPVIISSSVIPVYTDVKLCHFVMLYTCMYVLCKSDRLLVQVMEALLTSLDASECLKSTWVWMLAGFPAMRNCNEAELVSWLGLVQRSWHPGLPSCGLRKLMATKVVIGIGILILGNKRYSRIQAAWKPSSGKLPSSYCQKARTLYPKPYYTHAASGRWQEPLALQRIFKLPQLKYHG